MTFDPSKTSDVEKMSAADFPVWRTSKQNEVIAQMYYFIDLLCAIQIASHAAGTTFNHAARTMMTLATSAYVEVAYTLRELSILDTSGNRDGFTNKRRDDILKQLRGQYETGRKLFTFAIANASKDVQSSITYFIPKYL